MAVARDHERPNHLEPHGSAVAATSQREVDRERYLLNCRRSENSTNLERDASDGWSRARSSGVGGIRRAVGLVASLAVRGARVTGRRLLWRRLIVAASVLLGVSVSLWSSLGSGAPAATAKSQSCTASSCIPTFTAEYKGTFRFQPGLRGSGHERGGVPSDHGHAHVGREGHHQGTQSPGSIDLDLPEDAHSQRVDDGGQEQ